MPSRDPRQFVELLMASQRRLYAFIRSQVYSRDDADDIMQQTSVVLWEKFDSFQPDGDFTRWACGIARLEVLSHLRNQKRLRVLLREDVAEAVSQKLADAAVEVNTRLDMLAECMKDLSRRERDIVVRHYHKDEPVSRIAAALGISESSIYKSLGRTRDALCECIRRRLAEKQKP